MADTKKDEKVTTQEVKQEIAEQSKKNRANGGKDVEISITDTVRVKFTKDHGFMKKGQEARISVLAFKVYDKNKCVEKIN